MPLQTPQTLGIQDDAVGYFFYIPPCLWEAMRKQVKTTVIMIITMTIKGSIA